MSRSLYQMLLFLHPPAFRRQFAGEMLWIYDEAASDRGLPALFADGLLSLVRQWLLRSGIWMAAAALLGGILQVSLGGLAMWLVCDAQMRSYLAIAPYRGEWKGTIQVDGAPKPMELQIENGVKGWNGALSYGGVRDLMASNLKLAGNEILFRLETSTGNLNFRGHLESEGELRGSFQGAGHAAGSGYWKLSLTQRAEAADPTLRGLIWIATLLVMGLFAVVMALMLWVRKSSARRWRRLRGGSFRKCSNYAV